MGKLGAIAAFGIVVLIAVVGCGAGSSSRTGDAHPSPNQGQAAPSGYASTDTCDVLTADVASGILGGPTHIVRAHSATRAGNSNCERALNGDTSNFVILGSAELQALIRGLADPNIHSAGDVIKEVHSTLQSSCTNGDSTEPGATSGPGVNLLSYPSGISSDAILCVENPDTNAEHDELIWTHSGTYYTFTINLDEDDNAPASSNRAIAALREMRLPGK